MILIEILYIREYSQEVLILGLCLLELLRELSALIVCLCVYVVTTKEVVGGKIRNYEI